jgi:hypothetical protein
MRGSDVLVKLRTNDGVQDTLEVSLQFFLDTIDAGAHFIAARQAANNKASAHTPAFRACSGAETGGSDDRGAAGRFRQRERPHFFYFFSPSQLSMRETGFFTFFSPLQLYDVENQLAGLN